MSAEYSSNAPHQSQAAMLWQELCDARTALRVAEGQRDAAMAERGRLLGDVRKALADALTLCEERDAAEADRDRLREVAASAVREGEATASRLRHELTAQRDAALAERDQLAAFKAWVHAYLDAKGVPHSPPGVHGACGCRIGDRMDWVWAERDRLRDAARAFLDVLDKHQFSSVALRGPALDELRRLAE